LILVIYRPVIQSSIISSLNFKPLSVSRQFCELIYFLFWVFFIWFEIPVLTSFSWSIIYGLSPSYLFSHFLNHSPAAWGIYFGAHSKFKLVVAWSVFIACSKRAHRVSEVWFFLLIFFLRYRSSFFEVVLEPVLLFVFWVMECLIWKIIWNVSLTLIIRNRSVRAKCLFENFGFLITESVLLKNLWIPYLTQLFFIILEKIASFDTSLVIHSFSCY